MILPCIFPLSLGLGLAADREPPARFPAKIIVAWDDGAVIERPISPDYSYFSHKYVKWRQGINAFQLRIPVNMERSENIGPLSGSSNTYFVYRELGSRPRLFFVGDRGTSVSSDPFFYVLFDGGRQAKAGWIQDRYDINSVLTEKIAGRLCWFLHVHLGMSIPVHQEWSWPQSSFGVPPKTITWRTDFFNMIPWDAVELARSSRPDSMDPFEQMEVVLLQRPECSIAWMPEGEFQTTFGWGDPFRFLGKP
jgi:hypothetical protein